MGRVTDENSHRWGFDRKRFIRRAEHLKAGDIGFRRRLDGLREQWKLAFPQFALANRTAVPTDHLPTRGDGVYPPAVLAAREELQGDEERYASLNKDQVFAYHEKLRSLWGATTCWDRELEAISLWGWPLEDFPHPRMGVRHPAESFVALCILFSIEDVPTSSISSPDFGPQWMPVHPADIDDHPVVVSLRTQVSALEEELRLIANEAGLGESWAKERIFKARGAGFDAPGASPHLLFPSNDRGIWFVPITPGLTADVWTTARPSALRTSDDRYGGEPLGSRIRHYRAQGMGYQRIADHLGVPKSTVRDHVRRCESR